MPTKNHDITTKNDPTLRHPKGKIAVKITKRTANTKNAAFTRYTVSRVLALRDDILARNENLSEPAAVTYAAALVAKRFNLRAYEVDCWCTAARRYQTDDGRLISERERDALRHIEGYRGDIRLAGYVTKITDDERVAFEAWERASVRLAPFRDLVHMLNREQAALAASRPTEEIAAAFAALDDQGRTEMRRGIDGYLTAADIAIELRRLIDAARAEAIEALQRRIDAEPLVASTAEVA